MRDLRIAKEIGLREMAIKVGITAGYLCDLEFGRRPWGPKLTVKFTEALK